MYLKKNVQYNNKKESSEIKPRVRNDLSRRKVSRNFREALGIFVSRVTSVENYTITSFRAVKRID